MWPFPSRKRVIVHADMGETLEKIERLEIAQRRNKVAIDELSADLEALSERLNGQLGRILGGGAGRPPKARGGPGGGLESIPRGDKAALRKYFAENPPAPTATVEEQ